MTIVVCESGEIKFDLWTVEAGGTPADQPQTTKNNDWMVGEIKPAEAGGPTARRGATVLLKILFLN